MTRNYALMHANGMKLSELMRIHAHDLAEEIRSRAITEFDSVDAYNQWIGQRESANLIDPEVRK